MMKNVDVVIIIPAYNPDKKLLVFLEDLIKAGYNKIIIIKMMMMLLILKNLTKIK